ncbi:MAG: RagB/SusD family nutrient uptake outer membrane protein, partial [Bacteroidales bacterium]|nr:RagB/SusD family nutrient uptake outer membrane protein [Bacteroidales bacterium]
KSNPYLNYSSKTDITGATANGVRARVALVMEDWDAARRYADAAINSGAAKLMTQEQYQDGFCDASNPEWMWGFEMIADQTLYFYGYMAYMSWNFNSSNIRGCPKCINSKLYDKIPDTDVRKTLWDPTGKAWTMPTSSFKKYPYMNRKFAVKDYTSSVADANYMRLGEMYLIAAEAAAKAGDNAAAQDYLYTLNKTRDSEYQKSTKTGDDLLDEIYTYLRIELWGEGHRFHDLKRLNMARDSTGPTHVPALAAVMDVPAGDIRWKFAIPQDEIDANDLIDPNVNK